MNQQSILLAALVKQFGQQVDEGRAYEVTLTGKTLLSIHEGVFEHSTEPISLGRNLIFRFRPVGPTIDGGKLTIIPEKVNSSILPSGADEREAQKEESESLDS